jgi:hypothetical protein
MGQVHFASSTVHSPWTALRVRWVPLYCFPTLSLRAFAMCAVFPHSDSYALFDCLQGLGAFGPGLPSLLPTLLAIPGRLSRVRHGGLKRNAVGGVFLTAPSALCGFLVVTRGRSGLPVLSVAMHAKYIATIHTTTDRLWVLVPRADISSKVCQGWHSP